jgi:hypothetical protein
LDKYFGSALIILPFITSAFLKIASRVFFRRGVSDALDILFFRYKQTNSTSLILDQVTLIKKAIFHVSSKITAAVTVVASTLSACIIAFRYPEPWLLWIFMAAIAAGFLVLLWVYTREIYFSSGKGLFSVSNGTWMLIVFCGFDVALAIISAAAFRMHQK